MSAPQSPTIGDIRELFNGGLSPALLDTLPGALAARARAVPAERLPLYVLASSCRQLRTAVTPETPAERLRVANTAWLPAADAILDALEFAAPRETLYDAMDRFVGKNAAAIAALTTGRRASAPVEGA